MSKFKAALFLVFWTAGCLLFFNEYAYEISQANAKLRVLLTQQKTSLRKFVDGIPVSYSSKREPFVSPFYVVHYGIYFSEDMEGAGKHWDSQNTLKYWNVKPSEKLTASNKYYFRSAIEWLKENKKIYKGKMHYVYNFDWHYRNHTNGGLAAPWWSGLTDGYSLILLLRAFDYTQDEEYLNMTKKLYLSVTSLIGNGGSLNQVSNCPWIEEYVDPRLRPEQLSHVLNGAVYAAHGVEAYERYSKTQSARVTSDDLYSCIEKNIDVFDRGIWSNYDALGNSSNIKYHRINYYLMKGLVDSGKIIDEDYVKSVLKRWKVGVDNPGYGYITNGPRTVAYYHYIAMFFVALFFPAIFFLVIRWLKTKRGLIDT